MVEAVTLERYLQTWVGDDTFRPPVSEVVKAISSACREISKLIAQGPLIGDLARVRGNNMDGDEQKELDLLTNELLIDSLRKAPVAFIASEELEEPLEILPGAPLCVAIDPLDGSSNIDTNLSIGTIFSILPSQTKTKGAPLLQPGINQLAAGYAIYGPQTELVITLGEGTHIFTLDPTIDEFRLTRSNVLVPQQTQEFAINISNFKHWDGSTRSYISHCLDGENSSKKSSYNMRWNASLVAECHRILSRGGIYLYPSDDRPGYENGRLRLVYELNPIGWLIEQAGGGVTTGSGRVLELMPTDIHQRAPIIFGSYQEVARVENYYSKSHSSADRSPLFGQRGLFRI